MFDYMICQSALYKEKSSDTLTFGASDKILLHRPAGPPAPPGISLNSAETGPLTLVPIISPFAFSKTHAVSSNLDRQLESLIVRDRYRTNLTLRPSDLNSVFFVLTTTARLMSPFLTF
jgi:hypothetical protein